MNDKKRDRGSAREKQDEAQAESYVLIEFEAPHSVLFNRTRKGVSAWQLLAAAETLRQTALMEIQSWIVKQAAHSEHKKIATLDD